MPTEHDWPFVGRAEELGRVRDLLAAPGSRGAILAGPAGVGKTRLAAAAVGDAERMGFALARVTATRAASQLPFGALAPILPPVEASDVHVVDDRADLLRRTAAALVDSAGARRLLLWVDDAHLLDATSAVLLHQLVETDAASVLAVLRTGEPAPDPVVTLWKDGLLERVAVEGLAGTAISEVLAAALSGPVDQALVDDLVLRCQGNVLFLRELVNGALEDGSLSNDGGLWRQVGPLSPSERLIELVDVRLRRLDDTERAVLELVSFGEPLGPAELNTLADPAVVERLERFGLLASHCEDRRLAIRMGHPIYGDVVRARIPGLRARAIVRSLAEAVEATGARRRGDILRVASWRLDGGGASPGLLLAGATTARWHYDFALAERLARAADEAGAGFDAALLAAQLAVLQGRPDDAERQLATLADSAVDDDQRGQVAISRLDNVAFFQGRIEDGLRIAEQAEAAISDPTWRDEITARRSGILLGTRGPEAGAEAAEPLLQRAKGRALVWASLIASRSLGRLGRLEAALDAATQGYAADLELSSPFEWYPWLHIHFRCDALLQAGFIDDAEALAYAQYQDSLAQRSVEARAFFAWQLCKSALGRGRVQTATRYGRESAALFKELGRPLQMYFCLPYLATAQALAGRADDATETLETLDRLGLDPTFYIGVDPIEARAWCAVANADLPTARGLLEKAATLGESIGDRVGAATALHGLARLGQARAVAARLAEVAAPIEGELARVRVAHAQGLASSDAAALGRVSAQFEGMGFHLLAAEAATDAAVFLRRSGHRREAAAAERRAGTLADRCEGAVTPALQGAEGRARLSPSERDAVFLAAAGRSNKEIAEKLHLSVRTVETYLQRAYDKLGVSGRDELAFALEMPDRSPS